jgi:hypothetical protein
MTLLILLLLQYNNKVLIQVLCWTRCQYYYFRISNFNIYTVLKKWFTFKTIVILTKIRKIERFLKVRKKYKISEYQKIKIYLKQKKIKNKLFQKLIMKTKLF